MLALLADWQLSPLQSAAGFPLWVVWPVGPSSDAAWFGFCTEQVACGVADGSDNKSIFVKKDSLAGCCFAPKGPGRAELFGWSG